jgi:DNA-binding MarR family transcriptional regulator
VARPLAFDAIEEARRQWEQRWPESASAMATATSVMRAQQIILKAVDEALRPFGLTFARYEALVLLSFSRTGSLPLGKMGQRLMIHPTSVTNIIDRLVRDRLVERRPHPSDRRTTLASLLPEGRDLTSRATGAVNVIDFGVASLTSVQQRELISLVKKLRLSANDFQLR